jgi:hypothetical protein
MYCFATCCGGPLYGQAVYCRIQKTIEAGFKGIVSRDWKACRWFHWIDLKFKGIRYLFIFNLNVVFTTDYLKMAPIRVRFSPGFLPGAGFHGEEFSPSWFKTIT